MELPWVILDALLDHLGPLLRNLASPWLPLGPILLPCGSPSAPVPPIMVSFGTLVGSSGVSSKPFGEHLVTSMDVEAGLLTFPFMKEGIAVFVSISINQCLPVRGSVVQKR